MTRPPAPAQRNTHRSTRGGMHPIALEGGRPRPTRMERGSAGRSRGQRAGNETPEGRPGSTWASVLIPHASAANELKARVTQFGHRPMEARGTRRQWNALLSERDASP